MKSRRVEHEYDNAREYEYEHEYSPSLTDISHLTKFWNFNFGFCDKLI